MAAPSYPQAVRRLRESGWLLVLPLALALLWRWIPALTLNGWSVEVNHASARGLAAGDYLAAGPDDHERALLWRGLAALQAGNPQLAQDYLLAAASRQPQDRLVRIALGRAYEANGLITSAADEWRTASAWSDLIRAAQRSLSARRWDDALFLLKIAEPARPLEVISFQAQALRGKGDMDRAVDLLRKSVAARQESQFRQEWLILLADYLGQQGVWAEAALYYQQAIDTADQGSAWRAHIGLGRAFYNEGAGIDPALREIQIGITLQPGQAAGYMTLGDLLRQEQRQAEAITWYQKAVQLDQGSVWIWTRLVDTLVETGKLDEALALVSDVIQRFPQEPHPYYQLGQLLRQRGDLSAAIAAAERSATLDASGNTAYQLALAGLYAESGQYTQAIRVYRLLVASDAGNTRVHVAFGQALLASGADGEAIVEFTKAIELDSADPNAYVAMAAYYRSKGQFDEAEGWYQLATERSTSDPWPWVARGENALLGGHADLAIQVLADTTARFPDFAHGFFFLARAYFSTGDLHQAKLAIEHAVGIDPTGNAWYWLTAGQIYEAQGRPSEARAAYAAGLELDAGNTAIDAALSRLNVP